MHSAALVGFAGKLLGPSPRTDKVKLGVYDSRARKGDICSECLPTTIANYAYFTLIFVIDSVIFSDGHTGFPIQSGCKCIPAGIFRLGVYFRAGLFAPRSGDISTRGLFHSFTRPTV